MDREQLPSQNNGKAGLPTLMDAALMDVLSPNDAPTTPEPQTDKEISTTPEKNNKNLPTKIAVGALAVAMAIGSIVGLGKLTEKTASAKITIYDPKNVQEQICSTQATLEESLGLPRSTSYDTFRGCGVTTNMVTETEGGLKPGDEVKIDVTANAFGGAAAAEKVENRNN